MEVDAASKKKCHFEPFNLDFSKKYTVCYSQENCNSSLTSAQSTSYMEFSKQQELLQEFQRLTHKYRSVKNNDARQKEANKI